MGARTNKSLLKTQPPEYCEEVIIHAKKQIASVSFSERRAMNFWLQGFSR